MMKQWQFAQSGHPRDVLHLAEVPIPTTCARDEAIVKINYVSLNSAVAYKLMKLYGLMDPVGAYKHTPCVPEMDFSGIVILAGEDSKNILKPGDRVFGASQPWFMDLSRGVLREYAIIKFIHLIHLPDSLSMKDGCCFGAAGITCYYAMKENKKINKIKKGDRILITGASGGVGVMAVQYAKHLVGKEGLVVASCGTSKVEAVLSLGADVVIDYQKHNLPFYLKENYNNNNEKNNDNKKNNEKFDFIYDLVGNDHSLFSLSPNYLKEDGIYYCIGFDAGDSTWSAAKRITSLFTSLLLPAAVGGVPRKFIFESTQGSKERMENLITDIIPFVKPIIDSEFNFINTINAYERQMSHEAIGKVVIKICD